MGRVKECIDFCHEALLGPPAIGALVRFLFFGEGFPLLKSTTEKSWFSLF